MSLVSKRTVNKDGPPSEAPCSRDSGPGSSLKPSSYFRWKGIFDRASAAVMLIPAVPIIGLLIVLVRLTSKGPAIYSQTRVGKGGRVFKLHKIRTMRVDAERETGPTWTKRDDDRITPMGRVLRKTHLDELPQLYNVLRGEMSLIGPRPERPEFVAILSGEIPGYSNRLKVTPGISGLSQINLEPDVDLESVYRKLVLDTEYIKKATLFIDFRMLLCTSLRLFGCRAEWAKHVTHLHRDVPRLSVCVSSGGDANAPESEVLPTARALSPLVPGRNGGKNGSSSTGHKLSLRSRANAADDTVKAIAAKPR